MPIERLEARIAPASLLNPTTVSFQDIDGDVVTLKLSKPLFDAATINSVLKFSAGSVDGNNSIPQQLQSIDLGALNTPGLAEGLGLTLSAKRSAADGGDGLVNVGSLKALNVDLGQVAIGGDLGDIEAGNDNFATPSIRSLTVGSMGALGSATQAPGADLHSHLKGFVPTIVIKGNVVGAVLEVVGESGGQTSDIGGIGKLHIGGWLLRGTNGVDSMVLASGAMGSVSIGASDHAGGGLANGSVVSLSSMGSIKLAGSAMGGSGSGTGASINMASALGQVLGDSARDPADDATPPAGDVFVPGSTGAENHSPATGDAPKKAIPSGIPPHNAGSQSAAILSNAPGVDWLSTSLVAALKARPDLGSGALEGIRSMAHGLGRFPLSAVTYPFRIAEALLTSDARETGTHPLDLHLPY